MSSSSLWNKVWHARVPSKVRVFVWHLLKDIILTKRVLAEKVQSLDMDCIFCTNYEKSDDHLFCCYSALDGFWLASSYRALPRLHPSGNLSDWIQCTIKDSTDLQIDKFFTCLWVVWNEGCFNPTFMATWASNYLESYQKLHPIKIKSKKRTLALWECPPSGRLKMNIVGAYHARVAKGGIDIVVRDEHRQFLAALAWHLPYASSALQVVLEACRTGMLMAIHQG